MGKKLFSGFISVIKPVDIRFCIAVIQEENSDKYKIVFSDIFIEINGHVIDITDYDIIDEFDNIETAHMHLPVAVIALDMYIRDQIQKLGGTVGDTKITFKDKGEFHI